MLNDFVFLTKQFYHLHQTKTFTIKNRIASKACCVIYLVASLLKIDQCKR